MGGARVWRPWAGPHLGSQLHPASGLPLAVTLPGAPSTEGPDSSGGQLISAVCGDALRAGTPPSHGGSSLLRSCRSCCAQGAGPEAGLRAEGEGQGPLSPPTRPGPESSEPCPQGPGARRHTSALHPRGPAPDGHCASSFRAGVGHRARAPPAPGVPPARTPAPLDAPPNWPPSPRYPYTSTRAPPSHPTHSAPPRTRIALATTHGPQARTMPCGAAVGGASGSCGRGSCSVNCR